MASDQPSSAGNQPADNSDAVDDQGTVKAGEKVALPELVVLKKQKKRKKKNRKPSGQRGLDKPTGFEEYHADAPPTPDQHAEDQELYGPDIPFVERILTAIQRFERTRKLSSERRDIFYKYLAYGGIEVGPSMLQGGQDTSEMDKTQLAAVLAHTSISSDKHDLDTPTAKYAVDFYSCMAAFLSRRAMYLYGFDTHTHVATVTTTLERFLDYLLQHDVCPEPKYRSDILRSRALCRTAATELWATAEAGRWLPGDFNIACSTLCDGAYARNYDGVTDWGPPSQGSTATFIGMTPAVATQVVSFGIAGAASEDIYQAHLAFVNEGRKLEVIDVREAVGFEITRIDEPSRDCVELYKTAGTNIFRPVGRVHAKPWKNPDAPPEDLTVEERAASVQAGLNPDNHNNSNNESGEQLQKQEERKEEYVFLIESVIQIHLRIGMKLEATVHKLNCGIYFFDEFLRIFPSFDTYLCNELMVGWKEPQPLLPGVVEHVDDNYCGGR